jgi:hypothetical protein
MHALVRSLMAGAAAGAAGTTALKAVTYLDMALRGRPASSAPEQTVEIMSRVAHVTVPGTDATRPNRVTGVAALLGMATGVAIGVVAGAARDGAVQGQGVRLPYAVGAMLTAGGAMLVANGPMTVLGVTDPRTWSRVDWLSDVVPHLAYGAVTSATLRGMLPA